MHVQTSLDLYDKVNLLGQQAQYDLCDAQGKPVPIADSGAPSGHIPDITHSVSTVVGAGGRPVPVLKILQTSACEKNCYYCPFRAGRSQTQRITFTPDEMAGSFDTLQRAGLVDGMFLSSGIIKGGVTAQDKIIDTAEIMRKQYSYRGYIHLKICLL